MLLQVDRTLSVKTPCDKALRSEARCSQHACILFGRFEFHAEFPFLLSGSEHLVALATDGKVFAAGSGFQGQLGIGQKQFDLDDEEPECFEWSHDAQEYSEEWQQVDTDGVKGRVVKIAAGSDSTLFVVKNGP